MVPRYLTNKHFDLNLDWFLTHAENIGHFNTLKSLTGKLESGLTLILSFFDQIKF